MAQTIDHVPHAATYRVVVTMVYVIVTFTHLVADFRALISDGVEGLVVPL